MDEAQNDAEFKSENCYLIAFRGRLFRVWDSLSVFAVPQFSAIGSGGDFATAALYLGHNPKSAAKVAAALDLYCSGKIDTMIHRESSA